MKDNREGLPMAVTAPLTQAQKTQIINLVRRAARTEILPRFQQMDQSDIHQKSGEMDIVTQADLAAEAMLTRGLQISFPHALVIGEEAVAQKPELLDRIADAELAFILDPIDGTWNFAHGVPAFGTMVSVCRFGAPVFGLIYEPISDEVILADHQSPAQKRTKTNQVKPIRGRDPRPLEQMVGYFHIHLMKPEAQSLMWDKVGVFAHSGALRCSAHEYRLLATGAVDFVLSSQLNAWDHVAGALITQQAGGMYALLDGTPYNAATKEGYLLVASNGETWDMVAEHLSGLLSLS